MAGNGHLSVGALKRAPNLDAVQREPDGVLKPSAIAAVMCADGTIGLLGLDMCGDEFLRAPLTAESARWLIGELGRLVEGMPPAAADFDQADEDGQEPCDRCGDHHPRAVLEQGLCPLCGDDEGEDGEGEA
jgi:hypothetical protein